MGSNFAERRKQLVDLLMREGIVKKREVIQAMLTVSREDFVPDEVRDSAYEDRPLPIFDGQTISAPHMVAMMCEALELEIGQKVLEIGAGSGYHAAVSAEIVASSGAGHVYSVEIRPKLTEFATKNLARTGYTDRVTVTQGDGSQGLDAHKPFDRIWVTAAAPSIPNLLSDQLSPNGILVIPLGGEYSIQELVVARKDESGRLSTQNVCGVAFVPLVGKYGWSH
ncbi:MAG: protein-L-isoaspartate(D-aspartate) O-methyltransferase [Candidatus Bathyarchaeia archaeon]